MGLRFFILFFCGAMVQATAQVKKIDSLNLLLKTHPQQDSTYLDVLNDLAWYQCFNNAREGLKSADRAIKLAQKLQDSGRLVTAYSRRAVNLNTRGMDSLALSYYDRVIAIHKKNGDSVRLARTAFNKGIVYFNRSDYLRSTANYQRALSIFDTEGDTLTVAKIRNSMGINQMTLGNYPKAFSNYLLAARMYERASDTASLDYANILNNMGLLQARLGDLDEAQAYGERALGHLRKLGHKEPVANVLTNLGNIYKDQENYGAALLNYKKALALMREIGNKTGIANALCNMGATHILTGEHDLAIAYLDSTRPMYEETGNSTHLAELHQGLGEAYRALHLKQKDIQSLNTARGHFKKATVLAGDAGVLNLAERSWKSLANALSLSGKYKEAFEADEMAMRLRDSLNLMSQKEETARLEADYAFAQQEDAFRQRQQESQSIAQQEIARQKTIKNTIIIAIILATIALFSIWFLNARKRQARTDKEHAEQELQIAKTQLKALQAQLNPHFMFNSMNAVSAFILNKSPEEALDYLAKIAGLIRRTLQYSEKQFILLKDEVRLMQDYISLEIARASGKISYAIAIADEIDAGNAQVPPGILQPFIENSIWHGPGSGQKDVHISITIERRADHLFCVVEDNGVGRAVNGPSEKGKHESMGFKIAKSRIEILNRMHKIKTSLAVIDKDEGLRIELKLPYQQAY